MTDFGGALKPLSENPDYKIAVLGVPFDEKSSYLRGAAGGPAAIRAVSTGKCYCAWTELGVDLEADTALVDLGDVDVSGDPDKTFALTEKAVDRILAKGAAPIVLGGDHSITYPVLRAFARHVKPLDVLHFDAHPDLYEDLYGDRLSHACPFARVLEDGLAAGVVQVGVRAVTSAHRSLALRHGVRMVEMKDIQETLHLRFANPVYVSFDLDALDPAFAPGVSHHEPGGLSTRQAVQVIQALKGRIVGLDVVELNPSRDPASITAAAAFKIVKETAGRMARPSAGGEP
ncbi:MAG TPA: agmatinase [Candidatus Aminicenantes bacterium]|nr:agmatinase [Candidatus Aminicenantes bacterium]